MSELGWVLTIFASAVVATNVALVLALRAGYRRIRRSRTLAAASLRMRAATSLGPRRELATLRVLLNDGLRSAQSAVELAVRSTGRNTELTLLNRRLQREGTMVSSQLRLLESEVDATLLRSALPVARSRVERVTDLVHGLRAAVASILSDPTDDGLVALSADVEIEVTALRAGMQELHELNSRDALPGVRRLVNPHTD